MWHCSGSDHTEVSAWTGIMCSYLQNSAYWKWHGWKCVHCNKNDFNVFSLVTFGRICWGGKEIKVSKYYLLYKFKVPKWTLQQKYSESEVTMLLLGTPSHHEQECFVQKCNNYMSSNFSSWKIMASYILYKLHYRSNLFYATELEIASLIASRFFRASQAKELGFSPLHMARAITEI